VTGENVMVGFEVSVAAAGVLVALDTGAAAGDGAGDAGADEIGANVRAGLAAAL
jgi:hypothetical protein